MTSKTFETAHHDNKILKVDVLFGNPRLLIKEFNGDARGFAFEPSDAPALALAILEAAGVEPDREPLDCQVSLGTIVADLQDTIKHNQAQAAAAKDQAELEAEALELFNQYRIATQLEPTGSWDEARPLAKEQWLAVARRAREMRAEK